MTSRCLLNWIDPLSHEGMDVHSLFLITRLQPSCRVFWELERFAKTTRSSHNLRFWRLATTPIHAVESAPQFPHTVQILFHLNIPHSQSHSHRRAGDITSISTTPGDYSSLVRQGWIIARRPTVDERYHRQGLLDGKARKATHLVTRHDGALILIRCSAALFL